MDEMAKCLCRRKATIADFRGAYWVFCSSERCWSGPCRKTKAGAIRAWNRGMFFEQALAYVNWIEKHLEKYATRKKRGR